MMYDVYFIIQYFNAFFVHIEYLYKLYIHYVFDVYFRGHIGFCTHNMWHKQTAAPCVEHVEEDILIRA